MKESCKTCKYIDKDVNDWPCIDCCEGDRYENKDNNKCHPYERPYGSDERDYYRR